jgi:hypothetical protein
MTLSTLTIHFHTNDFVHIGYIFHTNARRRSLKTRSGLLLPRPHYRMQQPGPSKPKTWRGQTTLTILHFCQRQTTMLPLKLHRSTLSGMRRPRPPIQTPLQTAGTRLGSRGGMIFSQTAHTQRTASQPLSAHWRCGPSKKSCCSTLASFRGLLVRLIYSLETECWGGGGCERVK